MGSRPRQDETQSYAGTQTSRGSRRSGVCSMPSIRHSPFSGRINTCPTSTSPSKLVKSEQSGSPGSGYQRTEFIIDRIDHGGLLSPWEKKQGTLLECPLFREYLQALDALARLVLRILECSLPSPTFC